MSNLVRWAAKGRSASRTAPSPWPSITIDQLPYWFSQFGYQGLGYGPGMIQTIQQDRETIQADFLGYINGAYKTNGAVFACIMTRMLVFSEARFQWRRLQNGRPGKLFGTKDLAILDHPWPNATTGDLLSKALVDVDLAGNFYGVLTPRQDGRGMKIGRLRPDWVTILLGSVRDEKMRSFDPSAELVGYIYTPGGHGSGIKPHTYLPHEVMHWAPIPDPVATYRGMSWVQPVITEVLGDKSMNTHKLMYFEQGASPNLVVSMDTGKMDRRTFQEWIDTFENEHSGAMNAHKTLYLGNGANATVVGSNLKDLDYAVVQGHTETRIAAAAGVPPIVVGFSEGLESATYSNYAQARRAFADKTLRPLWRNFAGSLETLIEPPPGAQMWYDDRDIPFLQEDQKDEAEVQLTKATAIKMLVDAGYDPDSIITAMQGNDFAQLTHSGMYSVQLRPPGQTDPEPDTSSTDDGSDDESDDTPATPPTNGSSNGAAVPKPAPKPAPNGRPGRNGQLSAARRATMSDNVGNVQQLAKALLTAKAGQ